MTMSHPKGEERLLDGFKIGETTVIVKELNNDELVVSFQNLPAYIEDHEIVDKRHKWGVSMTSPVKRRMWPGTHIADGTRFVRVKFNEEVQSLPYSTKFNTAQGTEYFRVIHDRQVKVCRLCIQPGHILRQCPELLCGVQGHYAKECGAASKKCNICLNNEKNCICNHSEDGDVSVSESYNEDGQLIESERQDGAEDGEAVSETPEIARAGAGLKLSLPLRVCLTEHVEKKLI